MRREAGIVNELVFNAVESRLNDIASTLPETGPALVSPFRPGFMYRANLLEEAEQDRLPADWSQYRVERTESGVQVARHAATFHEGEGVSEIIERTVGLDDQGLFYHRHIRDGRSGDILEPGVTQRGTELRHRYLTQAFMLGAASKGLQIARSSRI